MNAPRILFVDDEPDILEGLRLALRKQRQEWDMDFACGGAEAITALEKRNADVVVTDMRMPGMDGAELLALVRSRWPDTVRLVLSGHADGETLLRAMPVAHQFLSKPLQLDLLKGVMNRAIGLQKKLSSPSVRFLASKIGDLPSMPGTYNNLIRTIQDPTGTLASISAIVESDPLVTGRVLKLINSAYYSLGQEVSSVRSAVSLLGPKVLMAMAMEGAVLEHASRLEVTSEYLEGLKTHSSRCCSWVRRLLPEGQHREEILTMALIHDLGAPLMAITADPDTKAHYQRFLAHGHSTIEQEIQFFGTHHAELGAYLFGLWGLPLNIVEAVAYHHTLTLPGGVEPGPVAALHACDVLSAAEDDRAFLQEANLGLIRDSGLEDRFNALAAERPRETP
jgi:HD-like signal output (HDOD) protein